MSPSRAALSVRYLLALALAVAVVLGTEIWAPASEKAYEAAGQDIFAIRIRSYPIRRWADQAAKQYQQQGVNAFVAPSPKAETPPRFRLYLGKTGTAAEAEDLARALVSARVISSPWQVEPVSTILCRHRQTECDRDGKKERDTTADKRKAPPRRPQKPASVKKQQDHFRLIRSILGGVDDPENDTVIELDTSAAKAKGGGDAPPGPARSPASPFDLVPVTDP